MPIDFFDACSVCHAPTWTDDQIQLAKDLIKKMLPDTSIHFCEMHDVGIYIGSEELGRDSVWISYDFTDRNGEAIYQSAIVKYNGEFFREKEDFAIRYKGKIFYGYSLNVRSSAGVTFRKTLKEIVNDAVIAFKTLQAVEFEMRLKENSEAPASGV